MKLSALYKVAKLSKQAAHKWRHRKEDDLCKVQEFIEHADQIRKEHPGCGVAKLYDTIQPEWIGRINGIRLLYSYGFKLNKRVNYKRTTYSVASSFENLIEGMLVHRKNQIWQTDITYFKVGGKFYYLVFIIDIYTRKIIGYSVSDHLRTEANLKALKMAIKAQKGEELTNLVHHSDKGCQYTDLEYRKRLTELGIWISMGKAPQQNAYAERVNGTIKNEFLRRWKINSFNDLQRKVKQAVHYYNTQRIHNNLPPKRTPAQFEAEIINLYTQKRPTVIVYTEGNPKLKASLRGIELYPEKDLLALVCPKVYC